jgi:hypothetical protein
MKNSAKLPRLFLVLFYLLVGTAYSQTPTLPTGKQFLDATNSNTETAKMAALRAKAENGVAEAQSYLGYCYATGKGVSEDFVVAAKWFRKAADQNNADAQSNLGLCYATGKGVSEDFVVAAKWFRKAADQNNADAQSYLGYCYAIGQGVPQDLVEPFMTPEQITEGKPAELSDADVGISQPSTRFDPSKLFPVDSPPTSSPRFDWRFLASYLIRLLIVAVLAISFYWLIYRVRWKTDGYGQSGLVKILETAGDYTVAVVKLIAAVLLFAALGRDTNDYYIILRCIACGVCAYTAFQAAQIQKFGWLFVFGVFAIMLNPIAPLHLKRASWTFVDIAAAVLLLLSIVIMDIRKPRP